MENITVKHKDRQTYIRTSAALVILSKDLNARTKLHRKFFHGIESDLPIEIIRYIICYQTMAIITRLAS